MFNVRPADFVIDRDCGQPWWKTTAVHAVVTTTTAAVYALLMYVLIG